MRIQERIYKPAASGKTFGQNVKKKKKTPVNAYLLDHAQIQ